MRKGMLRTSVCMDGTSTMYKNSSVCLSAMRRGAACGRRGDRAGVIYSKLLLYLLRYY